MEESRAALHARERSGRQFCRGEKPMAGEMKRKGPFASVPDGIKSSKAPKTGTHLLRFQTRSGKRMM